MTTVSSRSFRIHVGASTPSATTTFAPYGAVANRTGTASLLGFQGQPTDPSTGFTQTASRLYDPMMGSFTSRDSLFGASSDPMSLNQYAYGGDSPVGMSDPSGAVHTVQDHGNGHGFAVTGWQTCSNGRVISDQLTCPNFTPGTTSGDIYIGSATTCATSYMLGGDHCIPVPPPPPASCWGWHIGGCIAHGVAAVGGAAFNASPVGQAWHTVATVRALLSDHPPDYVSVSLTGGFILGGGGINYTLTRDGHAYAGFGLGATTPGGSLTASAGYINAPNKTAVMRDAFVEGGTVQAAGFAPIAGGGVATSFVWGRPGRFA